MTVATVVQLRFPSRAPLFKSRYHVGVQFEGPVFPPDLEPDENGLLGWGANLDEATLLEAYSKGVFPWSGEQPIPWYSPDPRLVLYPNEFRAPRSLTRLARSGRYRVSFDAAFRRVMEACAETPRPGQNGTWINGDMVDAYTRMHERWFAHSVEVWDDDSLVGGLYGVSLGRAFFGESMFHHARDASKLALYALCCALVEQRFHFIDCQQDTAHMRGLGATTIARAEYLFRLKRTLRSEGRQHTWSPWASALARALPKSPSESG